MNNTTINSIFKYAIIIGLAVITFIPLYVNSYLFFPFITGKGFAFRIIVEIIFALWLILILREKGSTVINTKDSVLPKINSITVAVTIFALVALVANLFGLNPLRSIWSNFERMEGWITIIHLWGYFMVLSSVINTKEKWNVFFNFVVAAGLITAIYGFSQFMGWAVTHQGSRVDASLGNSAYMAVYMLINVFIAFYLAFNNIKNKSLIWLYSILAIFFSFVMFQTATRGTILGWIAAILVSAGIYAVFARKSNGDSNVFRMVASGIIGFVILVSVLFYYNKDAKWIQSNPVLNRIASISISDTKTQARGFIWPMAIKSIFESPKTAIVGVGQENFNYIFNSHYNPKMFSHEQWFDRAHSVYLDWFVAGGLIGLITYLALYVISLIYIFKSKENLAKKSILVGLLVGYGIHNVFVFDNQTSYVMFFTVLAFIHTLGVSTICTWFKGYQKTPTEDEVTMRNYIYIPIIVILFISCLYFINIRPIQANKSLINSLISCRNTGTITTSDFEKALKFNNTMSNQEIREQLLTCTVNVVASQSASEANKISFYNLARKEIENQISDTPNDARIYIIAGTFYNSIRDFKSATPLLEKAATLSPNKQSIMSELSANYIFTGKSKEAVDVAEKSYLLAKDNITAKTDYIYTLILVGENNKAKSLISEDPSVEYSPKIINAYSVTKQYSKAIELYKASIKLNPNNQELYPALANVYFLNKQNLQAVETLKTAGEKFPLIKLQADSIIKQIQEGKIKLP